MCDDRLKLIQSELIKSGMDALFVKSGVNVLAMLGYWPCNHSAAGLIPAEGEPVLFVPETEYGDALLSIGDDPMTLRTYPLESTEVLRDSVDGMLPVLTREVDAMGLSSGKIGLEMSFEDGSVGRMVGDFKYPSNPTWDRLAKAMPKVGFIDASGTISKLRMVKTPREIDRVRSAIAAAI